MKRVLLILATTLSIYPLFGQKGIEVSKLRNETYLSFHDSGRVETLCLDEINPLVEKHKAYKDTTWYDSKKFLVVGEVNLSTIVGKVNKEMCNPLPPGVTENVSDIQVFNPKVFLSENRSYAIVVYNELYNNKSINIYSNATILIYSSDGKIYHQFEFGSAVKAAQISDDGRYIALIYEVRDEFTLVTAGFSIYDLELSSFLLYEHFPDNYRNPSCFSSNNILIISSIIGRGTTMYYAFILENHNLYSLLLDNKSKYSDLKITRDGFHFSYRDDPSHIDTFLFKSDFKQIINVE